MVAFKTCHYIIRQNYLHIKSIKKSYMPFPCITNILEKTLEYFLPSHSCYRHKEQLSASCFGCLGKHLVLVFRTFEFCYFCLRSEKVVLYSIQPIEQLVLFVRLNTGMFYSHLLTVNEFYQSFILCIRGSKSNKTSLLCSL